MADGMNTLLPLRIENLHFSIDQKSLITDTNICLSQPGICIIMGHNGAGKSLLIKCMHGLHPPTSGDITWNGAKALLTSTRQQQAMVFQKPMMLQRSVESNVQYVLKLRNKPASLCATLLRDANLQHKSKQPARSLSGGEQQRLAIARALACEPKILFLDEPTANLDPQATGSIESQILAASRQSIKIIMITHDVAQARRIADEIIFMHAGTATEHTPSEQFFNFPQSAEAQQYLAAYSQHYTVNPVRKDHQATHS